ncbi:MAG: efflux RND transporter periplasmic adaptor subunit [Gammaproteobacteria bacterium]|nr:efflux RND transporter periplasmic adaptor subunit [Gammaproteobacteria bacterium]
MKTAYRAIMACTLLPIFLTACTEEAPLPPPESRPVKTMLVGGEIAGDFRQFPGVVDAIQRADLSFRIQGKIIEILVKEGDMVDKGQLLAKLDPTDYQIVLNDRKASFKTAEANYERAKTLLEKGAISKVDHDRIRAEFFTAEANLKAAEQDIQYTSLKATFPGYIARRHVENFEEVRRKQTVFTLQDISELEIKVDVPETIMIQLRRTIEPGKVTRPKREMYAVFNQIKDVKFPLTIKEVSTTADPNTRTFQATLKMDHPEGYNVLPGMTATVFAQVLPTERGDTVSVLLPVSAVVVNTGKDPIVWILDEESMTVRAKPVTVGDMSTDSITVFGIEAGQRVVTAGAAFMREGMKVTLLQTGEQPGDQP